MPLPLRQPSLSLTLRRNKVLFLSQSLEEEFAREIREQQLFYARGGEIVPDEGPSEFHAQQELDGKPSSSESVPSQHGSQKSQDDNSSTKSSSGSVEI